MSAAGLLKEPLVHFLLLAGLLFGVEQYFAAGQKTRIVVDPATADYLIRQREDLELRTLSAEERAEVIDAYVEDEILYQEAYRRGLDRGDSRMRRNLILKMRGLLTGDLPEPSEEDLRAWFEANRDRFSRPATLDLQQIYFQDPATVPADLPARLQAGANPASFGESDMAQLQQLPEISQRFLVGTFGPVAARAILAIDDEAWHGPFTSVSGVHFVRVLARNPEVQATFEAVRPYLQGDWLMDQSRKAISAELARIRDDYEIVIETDS